MSLAFRGTFPFSSTFFLNTNFESISLTLPSLSRFLSTQSHTLFLFINCEKAKLEFVIHTTFFPLISKRRFSLAFLFSISLVFFFGLLEVICVFFLMRPRLVLVYVAASISLCGVSSTLISSRLRSMAVFSFGLLGSSSGVLSMFS